MSKYTPIKVRVYRDKRGSSGLSLDGGGLSIAMDSVGIAATGAGNTDEDPVEILCQWALVNLTPEQLEQLSKGLSLSERSATLARAPAARDGEEGVTGYPGGRRDGPQAGPGNAGPWGTAGVKPSRGAMDAGLRKLGQSFRDDAAAVSFDRIFNPNDREQSEDAVVDVDFFGRPVGEASPRFDHVTRPVLWETLR
jgi:hypothetical protein